MRKRVAPTQPRFLTTLFVVTGILVSIVSSIQPTPAEAVQAEPTQVSQVHNGAEITSGFKHWNKTDFNVTVYNGAASHFKVEVEIFLANANPAVDIPYWERSTDRINSIDYVSSVDVQAPPLAFQSGRDYKWRSRWWIDGQGGSPSEWSTLSTFDIDQASGRPGAPYPISPTGPMAPDDLILRVEPTQPGQSQVLVSSITEYKVEIKLNSDAAVYWETTVPAPANGADIEVNVPSLPADTEFKWRSYARTAAATNNDSQGSSSPSRWRYFQTTGPDFQASFDYIPHRAGSYLAGDTGDEVSGMVASRQYPNVYWMIRDNGPGDRARLYAIKIDPTTGELANLDGYSTKEFDVTGSANLDWEAISIDNNGNLYVFDSGAYWDLQPQTRATGQVYKIPEPNPYSGTSATVSNTYNYAFPPVQAFRNVEAVFTVGNMFFLIAKEDPHKVFALPRWLSANSTNYLTPIGDFSAEIGNITGAEFDIDLQRFALTTSPSKAIFWDVADKNYVTPTSASLTRAFVADFLSEPADSHYYYREAGAWEADGIFDLQTSGVTEQQRLQTGMQTEGIAFGPGHQAAMVSEYGRHTMFVPPTGDYSYTDRPGINTVMTDGTIPGTSDVLIPSGSWWHYDDDGAPQTDWNQPGANRNNMKIGTGLFGYPTAGASSVQTTLAAPSPSHVTDYFVQEFRINEPEKIWSLEFNAVYDDAIVVYLNGHEVWRDNMPAGTPTPSTLASVWRDDNDVFQTNVIQLEADETRSFLTQGLNTLAVEVHQNRTDSSDVFFDLELRESAPRPVTDLTTQMSTIGPVMTVGLDWEHETPTPVAYQVYEVPLTTDPVEVVPILLDTVTSTDYSFSIPSTTTRMSSYIVLPIGATSGDDGVVMGGVHEWAEVINLGPDSQSDIVDHPLGMGFATIYALDAGTISREVVYTTTALAGLKLATQTAVVQQQKSILARATAAICSHVCEAGVAGLVAELSVAAVLACLAGVCPVPDDWVVSHQIDTTRTIPRIGYGTPEGAAYWMALEVQLDIDSEIRAIIDNNGNDDLMNDYRWSELMIHDYIRRATDVCEFLEVALQAEVLAGAALGGASVIDSIRQYLSDAAGTPEGKIRLDRDGATILLQPCVVFPVYTPGAYKKPVKSADIEGLTWSTAPNKWLMKETSMHIRATLLTPESDIVTAPGGGTNLTRRSIVQGRDMLQGFLLHYQPREINPIHRQWYSSHSGGYFATECEAKGRVCDEYPFYTTRENSTSASLLSTLPQEAAPQGNDLNQFYGAANGCGIAAEYDAADPSSAAFIVIPMSEYGLGIQGKVGSVPRPSHYQCSPLSR